MCWGAFLFRVLSLSKFSHSLQVMNDVANDMSDKNSQSVALQYDIFAKLENYGSQLVPMLCLALQVGNNHARIGTALLLARMQAREATPYLMEAFKTDFPDVGAAVAFALGRLQAVQALPILMLAARKDFVAVQACEALGAIGHSDALPVIEECIERPGDHIKVAAARALGQLKYDFDEQRARATRLLSNLLTNPSAQIRLHAARALHKLGMPNPVL
jgi:HEAT repeat protein